MLSAAGSSRSGVTTFLQFMEIQQLSQSPLVYMTLHEITLQTCTVCELNITQQDIRHTFIYFTITYWDLKCTITQLDHGPVCCICRVYWVYQLNRFLAFHLAQMLPPSTGTALKWGQLSSWPFSIKKSEMQTVHTTFSCSVQKKTPFMQYRNPI